MHNFKLSQFLLEHIYIKQKQYTKTETAMYPVTSYTALHLYPFQLSLWLVQLLVCLELNNQQQNASNQPDFTI
jgi:hypothetical protein